MAAGPGDTRGRMLASAVTLLSRRGTAGTTVDAVLADSGAPRGSVYHHFPGGRDEIVVSAVRVAGGHVAAVLDRAAGGSGPGEVLDSIASWWRARLVATDFTAGCPVVALAVAGPAEDGDAARVVAEVFDGWQGKLAGRLTDAGVATSRAWSLSSLVIAAIQGAVILCRVRRSTVPLDDAVSELSALLDAATAATPNRSE